MGCANSSAAKVAEVAPLAPQRELIMHTKESLRKREAEGKETQHLDEVETNEPSETATEEVMSDAAGAVLDKPDHVDIHATEIVLDESGEVQVEEVVVSNRGAAGCGICAEQTDVHVGFGWGLFSLTAESVAGLGYCRCCSHPRGVAFNESATEIVVDESGEVQGEEVVVSKRGAMGCGILAAEAHAHLEKCWGLFSCNVESVGGLGYCRCCSHPRGVMIDDSATEIVLDDSGEVQGEEFVVSKRGAMGCGILAAETHAHLEKCWGLFSCNVESVGGLGYCRCCSHPRGVAFNESTTEIALDESGEVQGKEVVVSKRGAGGCGILAAETDVHLEKCWGLFSCNVESVGGLGYCRCCC